MNMQNLLNKLSALTTESLTMAGGSHAPADSHLCHTCGGPMSNWKPGDDHECAECADGDPAELDEATMCEVCSEQPCVCESAYSDDDPLDEATMCEVCGGQPCACGSDQMDPDGSVELARMKQMMAGQMPMAAAPVSGMNVTTNVDSTTGNKTVTVTADGQGAEDLMRILGLAGIAVAPAGAMGMAEQLANAPDPVTLDAQTQLVDMSGGPNAPHRQYNPARAGGDNPMAIDKNVGGLAAKLQARFVNETRTGQKNRLTRV